MSSYDVVVIGSGPGGYVAAIRCAQLGFKTALVEKYDALGGTCLNVGCIPSKALLDSSEHYHNAIKNFEQHGILVGDVAVDFGQMVKRKGEVVNQTVQGLDFLMKKNKIEVLNGFGRFNKDRSLSVDLNTGDVRKLESKHYIIATGSKPTMPKAFNYDKKRVISSTEALALPKVPKKMVVIGGGVIGLELGSVYARLGTEVSVVEYLDRILTGMDSDCARDLQRSLKKLGIKFNLGYEVTEVKATSRSVVVKAKKRSDNSAMEWKADYCLVAIGRQPYTEGLGLDNIGISLDERGRIPVNNHLETSQPGIFAIGDVIKGPMLAHKAEDEGVYVAEYMAGEKPHIDYNLIPGVVYTWPEVAAVGQTEDALKANGVPYKSGKFPMKALGRARASMDTDGFVKVLADAETDEILGVHMVGARAADIIAEAVALMEFRASAEDLARICHAHPTYTEAMKEAGLAATGNRPIHM